MTAASDKSVGMGRHARPMTRDGRDHAHQADPGRQTGAGNPNRYGNEPDPDFEAGSASGGAVEPNAQPAPITRVPRQIPNGRGSRTETLPSRGFLPWRLPDTGRVPSRPIVPGRHPKPFTKVSIGRSPLCGNSGQPVDQAAVDPSLKFRRSARGRSDCASWAIVAVRSMTPCPPDQRQTAVRASGYLWTTTTADASTLLRHLPDGALQIVMRAVGKHGQ